MRTDRWPNSFAALGCVFLSAVVTFCGFSLAEWRRSNPTVESILFADHTRDLGGEINAIAQSLSLGNGFSNPFYYDSGPTAWMPPIPPLALAGVYCYFDGDRVRVHVAMLSIQVFSIFISGVLVLYFGHSIGQLYFALLVLICTNAVNFPRLFQTIDDNCLNIPLMLGIFLGGLKYWQSSTTILVQVLWGIYGGITALCNPVFVLSWGVVTCRTWWAVRRTRARLQTTWLSFFAAAVIVSPWVVRNYLVFDRVIPIKSNLGYELWQSQCADDDGVLDAGFVFVHPAGRNAQRQKYVSLGEADFVSQYSDLAWRSVRADPAAYVIRLGRRLAAACIYYRPFNVDAQQAKWWVIIKRLFFPIPVIAFGLLISHVKSSSAINLAVWLFPAALLPYVLISYYERYAVGLIGLKMILVILAWSTIIKSRQL